MYNNLSPNLKSSITRSITQTFELYMESIDWSESKFNIEDYMKSWRDYIVTKALWYSEIPDSTKTSPIFHQEMAVRINEVIERILDEPPTKKQIENIRALEKQCNKSYDYSCKAEAAYVEKLLKQQLEQ